MKPILHRPAARAEPDPRRDTPHRRAVPPPLQAAVPPRRLTGPQQPPTPRRRVHSRHDNRALTCVAPCGAPRSHATQPRRAGRGSARGRTLAAAQGRTRSRRAACGARPAQSRVRAQALPAVGVALARAANPSRPACGGRAAAARAGVRVLHGPLHSAADGRLAACWDRHARGHPARRPSGRAHHHAAARPGRSIGIYRRCSDCPISAAPQGVHP